MRRLATLALLAMLNGAGFCQADESEIDALLSRWSQATARCQSLDTRIHHIQYDHLFGKGFAHGGEVSDGRYVFDDTKSGRFQMGREKAIVWQKGTTLQIDFDQKTYRRFTQQDVTQLEAAERAILQEPPSFLQGFRLGLCRMYLWPCRYREVVPLLLADVNAFRNRFELTINRTGGETTLTATPKQLNIEGFLLRRFRFGDGEDFPWAIQEVQNQHVHSVRLFYKMRVNSSPADFDELIHPDLSSLVLEPPLIR